MVYFVIELNREDIEKWELIKRYSDFDTLRSVLEKQFPDIPELPKKTFKVKKSKEDHEERRAGLEIFLKVTSKPLMRSLMRA